MADESNSDDAQSLGDHPYGDLMNLARSMNEQFDGVDINTDAPKKDAELVPALEDYDPEGSRADGWSVEVDGSRQDVELLQVQTPDNYGNGAPSEPTPDTVLYCLTRKATTEERVERIREALEDAGFEFNAAGDGDKFAIVEPPTDEEIEAYEEALAEYEAEQEAEDEAEDDEEAESGEESGASDDDGGEADEDEESADEESEADEEDEEDESDEDGDDVIPESAYRSRLEDKTKDEVYSIAVDLEVDDRSNMDKGELIDAVVNARIEAGDVSAS